MKKNQSEVTKGLLGERRKEKPATIKSVTRALEHEANKKKIVRPKTKTVYEVKRGKKDGKKG